MFSTRTSARTLRARTSRRTRQRAACALAVLGTGLAAGCAAPAQQGPAIKLSSAQVTFPSASGTTDIYVDVQNNGGADQIIGARISVGGTVTLRSPVRPGVVEMRSVRAIADPGQEPRRA